MSQECQTQSGNEALNADPARSFVIRRRNGDSFLVHVSDYDYERVMAAGPWHVYQNPRRPHQTPYVMRKSDDRKTLYLHQFILGAGGSTVDHENGCGLDNRRSNLRLASVAQNAVNRGPTRRSKSGVKGVFPCSQTGRWISQIRHDGKQHSLGRFDTIEEAAAAYREAAIKHHGSFARFE